MIASFVALGAFFNAGYPSGHDLEYHAATVVGMSQHSIIDIFTGKVYGCISNDLGYGEGFFYPPLAHTGAALIYKAISGFASVFTAFKIFYFLTTFLSGVFMYKFIMLISKHKKASTCAATLYITTPYFLVDILVRCAMAESLLFIFMPVILIALYYLIHDRYKKFLVFFVIGCVGIVNSHLVLTMYFVMLCTLGFLPKIKLFFQKKRFLYLLLGAAITTLISLPFLLPMLEAKNSIDYNVFQPGFMVNFDIIQNYRIPLDYLFSVDKVLIKIPLYLSLFGVVTLLYVFFNYKKIKLNNKNNSFLLYAIITTTICLFCSTTLFSWEHIPDTLWLIQFPWRLLSFVSLGMGILVGISIPVMEKKCDWAIYALLIVSCLFSISQINNHVQSSPKSQNTLPIDSAYVLDYVPVGITLEEIKNHNHAIISDNKSVIVSNEKSNTPNLSFNVEGVNRTSEITLPRYYFIGYNIQTKKIGETDYRQVEYYNKDGYISFKIDSDSEVIVSYSGTKIQHISYLVAGITALGCLVWVGVILFKKNNPKSIASQHQNKNMT